MTALTTAAGPYGAVALPILELLTIILNVYGPPVQQKESQEDMIKRFVYIALSLRWSVNLLQACLYKGR